MGPKSPIELPPPPLREKLIDDLMFSDADAGAIVSMHEKESEAEQARFATVRKATSILKATLIFLNLTGLCNRSS